MLKKIGRFFEEHVEKIVLIIIGLLCALLFIWRVLFSPNIIEYKNNEGATINVSPGEIDNYVYQDALQLIKRQSGPPVTDINSYSPKLNEFLAVLDSTIRNVDTRQIIPNPEIITPTVVARGEYNLPYIGQVTEVASEHIRAAAYVPIEAVTEQRTYTQVENEPNDIDLVTVEGKFDIAGLYTRFHESFVDQVEEQWADPCLAIPVFATVNLERRELLNDGTWGDWQNVPRPSIDHNKRLLDLIQEGNKLPPGGLKVQMLKFNDPQVQVEILQPDTYHFASAREEWFPPLLHRDYASATKKEMQQEKRDAREAELQERSREAGERRSTRTNARGGGMGGFLDGGGDGLMGGQAGSRRPGGRRTSRDTGFGETGGRNTGRTQRGRAGRQQDNTMMEMERFIGEGGATTMEPSPIDEVYREYNKIKINWTTDLSKMRDPLVFWAHDDTVEPENSYQYRIRLGVFNPVAEGDEDDVVLWSEFSDTTETIEIPGKLYFFVKGVQETARTVTVTVSKYFLGYWRSEDFRGVGPGEAIGGIVEYESEEPEEEPFIAAGAGRRFAQPVATPRSEETTVEPESINFDTGAVIVDVVAVNEWVTSVDENLSNRSYYDMLYSYDGTEIEHLPVGSSYWPEDMKSIYAQVQRLSRETKEPFKAFGSRGTQRRPGTGTMEGGFDDMYQETMMMEEMGRY